jgi:hypothetical protein
MMQAPPAPSPKLRAQLAKLVDLQKDAEQEARTVEELRIENANLKRAATIANKRAEQAGVPEADVQRRIREAVAQASPPAVNNSRNILSDFPRKALERIVEIAQKELGKHSTGSQLPVPAGEGAPDRSGPLASVARTAPARPAPAVASAGGKTGLPVGERAVLTVIAQHPSGATREQLTVITGYKRSTRDAYLQRMRERGLVDTSGDSITATDAGIAAIGPGFEPLPTGHELQGHWLARLPKGEAKILAILCQFYPGVVDRDHVSSETNYARSSRDAYLQRLKSRQLITVSRDGVQASPILFD